MESFKENIVYPPDHHLVVKEEHFSFNDFPFHHHPEFELIFILKGKGQRFVGDNIDCFGSGDLYFFGADLPHTFYNKHLPKARDMHQVVVQFGEDFPVRGFFRTPAFRNIQSFLLQAGRGYRFGKQVTALVGERLRKMVHMDGAAAAIELLAILDILSRSNDFVFLTSPGYQLRVHARDTERMTAVYDYILHHFNEKISLRQVSAVAYLSPEAFCRYFKKHTRKSFSQFLIEVRIGHACRLLHEGRWSVQEISVRSGFNNLSYFMRKFKAIVRKTPAEYRGAFLKKASHLEDAEMFMGGSA